MGEGVIPYPLRVTASAPKQPGGLTRTWVGVPLGCFGAVRLAMTSRGRVIAHVFHFPPIILILSPSKDEDEPRTILRCKSICVPACAGKPGERKQGPLRRCAPVPPEGEDLGVLNLPLLGEVPAKPG